MQRLRNLPLAWVVYAAASILLALTFRTGQIPFPLGITLPLWAGMAVLAIPFFLASLLLQPKPEPAREANPNPLAPTVIDYDPLVFEHVPDAVIVVDLGRNVVAWNAAAEAYYGVTASEAIGQPISALITSEWSPVEDAEARATLREHGWLKLEGLQRCPDGRQVLVECTTVALRDSNGGPTGFLMVNRDISARMAAEKHIRESETLHRLVLSSISDAVFMTDIDGNLTFICPNVDAIFGYTEVEVAHMGTISQLLGQDPASREPSLNARNLHNVPVEINDKQGKHHDLIVDVSQVHIGQARRLYVCRDVTERVASNKVLQRSSERLRVLRGIDRQILIADKLEAIADAALEGLDSLVSSRMSAVLMFESRQRSLRVLAERGKLQVFPGVDEVLPVSDLWPPSTEESSIEKISLVRDLSQVSDMPPIYRNLAERGLRSAMAVRLMAGEQLLGTLGLVREEVDAFDPDEIDITASVADSLAIALQNARLLASEKTRRRELEAVRKASLQLTSQLNLDKLLESLAASVSELVQPSDVHIFHYDDGVVKFGSAHWLDGAQGRPFADPRPDGLTYRVARSGQVIIVEDSGNHPLYADAFPDWRGGIAGLPLKTHGQVVGVMNVAYEQPHVFSENELGVLGLLADQAAIAIANARMYARVERQRKESESLLKLAQSLGKSHSLDSVLTDVVQTLRRLLPGAEGASLWLFDKEQGVLRCRASDGVSIGALEGLAFSPDQALIGEVFNSDGPKVYHSASQEPNFTEVGVPSLDRLMSNLGVPIRVGNQTIGTLHANNYSDENTFGSEDFYLIEGLAAQASVAIESARLFEQIQLGRARLQEVSRQLVDAQEAERRHLARELHDEIGQLLTGLKLSLQMMPQSSQDNPPQLGRAMELVDDLLKRVREMSLDLRPSMLDDLGLVPALEWLVNRYAAETQMDIRLEQDTRGERYPSEVETTCYRIVQEALTNVARHARSDSAEVYIGVKDDRLLVRITDHGRGFDVHSELGAADKAGLRGMMERAGMVGGTLDVGSAPGKGTRISARLPLSGQVERRANSRR